MAWVNPEDTMLSERSQTEEYKQHIMWNFFKFLFIYERQRDRERERGRNIGRGRSRLHSGNPMWDLIPRLQDYAQSWRQMLNFWTTQAYLFYFIFLRFYLFIQERHTGRGRDIGRGRRRFHAQGSVQYPIPGPRDHALARGRHSTTEPSMYPQFILF